MSAAQTIWVIDDDPSIRWVLEKALNGEDRTVRCFEDGSEAVQASAAGLPDLVLTDLRMPGTDGMRLLEILSEQAPDVPVVVMTAFSDLDTTVAAYAKGAHEYLPKPFDVDELQAVVDNALAQQAERAETAPGDENEDALIGESPAMQQVFRHIGRLARSHLSVLITGETGSGKELIARALHTHSPRAGGPFIALNTAAIPAELLESELFGHERGAFTGAQQRHRGRFEQADGGTLFLDEIGDMPASLQTRLLRVLAEGEFYRVGGHELIRVDVRVIAATHQDLDARVEAGQFREDLYHRLNVVQIAAPPLRDRGEDVVMLAERFLARAAVEAGLEPKVLDAEAAGQLKRHGWPGNVRELKNLCWRLTVMAPGQTVRCDDLTELLDVRTAASPADDDWEGVFSRWFETELGAGAVKLMPRTQDRLQALMFTAALKRTGGRKEAAAKLLGCGRNTLTRRLKELGLEPD